MRILELNQQNYKQILAEAGIEIETTMISEKFGLNSDVNISNGQSVALPIVSKEDNPTVLYNPDTKTILKSGRYLVHFHSVISSTIGANNRYIKMIRNMIMKNSITYKTNEVFPGQIQDWYNRTNNYSIVVDFAINDIVEFYCLLLNDSGSGFRVIATYNELSTEVILTYLC